LISLFILESRNPSLFSIEEIAPVFKSLQEIELLAATDVDNQDARLEHGFLRVKYESCHDEKLAAFSCKKRGFCPSRGARRMADSAALLVNEILPHQPMRQWVLSVPLPLRFLFSYVISGWGVHLRF